jgi:hypothetical protein
MVEADKVVPVHDTHLVSFNAKRLDRLDRLLVLDKAGARSVVGSTESVHDEIVVVWFITKVSAIGHIRSSIFGFCL